MSTFSEKDFEYMQLAIEVAKKGFEIEEVPVGCVIVKENSVIAKAHNLVQCQKKAHFHAEMLAIEQAAEKLGDWRLIGCTLYSTLEPCIMCSGAIILSRIEKLIWSAKDHRHGANGSHIDVFEKKHPIHHVEIQSGLLEEESSKLMKDFFKQRRVKV